MTTLRFWLAFAATLLLGSSVACGLDEHYTGMGQGALPGDPLYKAPDVTVVGGCGLADVEGAPLAVDSLVLRGYRFDTLSLSEPLPPALVGLVNQVVEEQLAGDLINILLLVQEDDRNAQTLSLGVVAGEPVDDGYRPVGDADVTSGTFTNGLFVMTESASLSISVDLGTEQLVLPVRNLLLSGMVSADGSDVSPGLLTGALTVDDAEDIIIVGTSLKDFLETQDPPKKPNLDLDQDGTMDAWAFEGCFTAKLVTVK
jgi:hypothetical protein